MLSATAYKHVIGVQFDPQKVGGALRPPLSNYLRPAKDARWSVEGDRVAQRDPTIQLIDVLAGTIVDELALTEDLTKRAMKAATGLIRWLETNPDPPLG